MTRDDIRRALRLLDWLQAATEREFARDDEWLVELLLRDIDWLRRELERDFSEINGAMLDLREDQADG